MQYLKLILAALLLACLLPMPYGYYTLIRFVSMVVFAIFAYSYHSHGSKPLAVTFGALVLLFQPFMKITLGRELWNIVDVAVAILLFIVWYKECGKKIIL